MAVSWKVPNQRLSGEYQPNKQGSVQNRDASSESRITFHDIWKRSSAGEIKGGFFLFLFSHRVTNIHTPNIVITLSYFWHFSNFLFLLSFFATIFLHIWISPFFLSFGFSLPFSPPLPHSIFLVLSLEIPRLTLFSPVLLSSCLPPPPGGSHFRWVRLWWRSWSKDGHGGMGTHNLLTRLAMYQHYNNRLFCFLKWLMTSYFKVILRTENKKWCMCANKISPKFKLWRWLFSSFSTQTSSKKVRDTWSHLS